MDLRLTGTAWDDYNWWIEKGQKSGVKKLKALIKDIQRNGYDCIGQAEALKNDPTVWYSVHVDKKNRMIFKVEDGTLFIKACLTHYGDT
jgi:toxin YoeB